jgi:outer membrane protein assembly factor BamA
MRTSIITLTLYGICAAACCAQSNQYPLDTASVHAVSPIMNSEESVAAVPSNYDVFAFPSYDSDTGIGAGFKIFLLNTLGANESMDLTVYASAKNERWVNATFSFPDFETRQGKIYSWAVDLAFDYDKYLLANFFPGYNDGSDAGKETYIREPVDVSATISRGFSPTFVGSIAMRYRYVSCYGFAEDSRMLRAMTSSAAKVRSLASITYRLRYDTRDSYVNPRNGIVAMAELETAQYYSESYQSFGRLGIGVQVYREFMIPGLIGALRVVGQAEHCDGAPFWMFIPLGGTSSLRGYAMDRFLGKATALVNAEIRWPIYKRLGGVCFLDAGNASTSLNDFRIDRFRSAPGIGLRLAFDTFVVRGDAGFSSEGGGLYLNFGQLF